MSQFKDFPFPAPLMRAIHELQYKEPTPIQAKAIPLALDGKDLIARAATGSGKTAAFLLPLLTKLLQDPEGVGLILTPTREIAMQTVTVFRKLAAHLPGMECALVIGGAPMGSQIRALARRPRVVIATPGRLNDHLDQRIITLDFVRFLILDEADRMLDMGFQPQLDRIARYLPRERQTLLFSATLPEDILRLSKKYLQNPESVSIGTANAPVPKITQKIVHVENAKKTDRLHDELIKRQGSVIVFTRTQVRADRLARHLRTGGFQVAVIHGGLPQGKRTRSLEDFRRGQARILVATDIAARGIDVPHVAHVVNYDLPQQADDYVHRIGRTARAGAEGEALCLVAPEEAGLLRDILRYTVGAEVEGQAPRLIKTAPRPGKRGGPRPPHGGGGGDGGRRGRFTSGPRREGQGSDRREGSATASQGKPFRREGFGSAQGGEKRSHGGAKPFPTARPFHRGPSHSFGPKKNKDA